MSQGHKVAFEFVELTKSECERRDREDHSGLCPATLTRKVRDRKWSARRTFWKKQSLKQERNHESEQRRARRRDQWAVDNDTE